MGKLDPKTDGATTDIVEQNIEKLKTLFPDVFTEGKVDLDALRETLGDYIDDRQERYSFTWNGKSRARRIAQTPSTGTLRPCPEESVNWDTTQNLFIEGDNLEVLKLLQKSYHKKVKMIYIDPPYNTGKDFIYPDDFHDNIKNYLELTGQTDGEGRRLSTNAETSGRYHTDWLNMMYPRLKLAHNLLRDDGVIFISIDDNEIANLRKLCDEVFGEETFRNTILVRRRVKSLNSQFAQDGLQTLNVGFEYVVVYAKSNSFTMMPLRTKKENASAKGRWDVFWSNADRPTMRYDVLGFTPKTGQWRYSKEKAVVAVENYKKYQELFSEKMTLEEYWEKTGCCLRFIRRIDNGRGKNGGVQHWVPPSETSLRTSTWTDIEVSQIHKEIDVPFDNPKNRDLPQELIKLSGAGGNDLILDFFAGSCTTAHAVFELNKEDGGNRRFIMVQLPEPCDEKSEAFKAGYKTIADIGKERMRRVIKKITDEIPEYKGDLGFKVFKLDASNIKPLPCSTPWRTSSPTVVKRTCSTSSCSSMAWTWPCPSKSGRSTESSSTSLEPGRSSSAWPIRSAWTSSKALRL